MKTSYLLVALSLLFCGAGYAQDQAKQSHEQADEPAKQAKFKAGKALADTVKAKAQESDYLDDDDDSDGLGDATEGKQGDLDGDGVGDLARQEAHELTHTVQQGNETADATKRKRPGRTKYADITLKKGAAAPDDTDEEADKPKKSDKKKGDNN